MNVYKLKNEEFQKLQKEFNKTWLGIKALLFSILQIVFCCCFLIKSISYVLDKNDVAYLICFLGVAVSFTGLSIAQIQYGNMLKVYIDTKKEK